MEISVLWSGTTLSHHEGQLPQREPERRRDVGHGGLPARRQRELPGDGERAASESASLTYTITIGPAGG